MFIINAFNKAYNIDLPKYQNALNTVNKYEYTDLTHSYLISPITLR